MKKLFALADDYIKTLHVSDFAMLKLCLIAFGLLLGISLPENGRRRVGFVASGVFVVTYLAAMTPFLRFLFKREKDIEELLEE